MKLSFIILCFQDSPMGGTCVSDLMYVHLQQVCLDRQKHVPNAKEGPPCGDIQPGHAFSSQKAFNSHNLNITVLSLNHTSTMAFNQLSIGEHISFDQSPLGMIVKEIWS